MTTETATAAQGRDWAKPNEGGNVLAGIGLCVATAALAAAQGAYFPSAWNWGALAFAWAAGLALAFASGITLSRTEVALLGLLAVLAGWIALSLAWTASTPETVDEVQRALLYVTGAAAFLLLARREAVGLLLGGLLAAL